MYRCTDCGKKFEKPKTITLSDDSLFCIKEKSFICPFCDSENIKETEIYYCRCCGRKLTEGRKDYCSIKCRKQGELLFERQKQKYKHIKESPIYKTVRMLEKYNKENGKNLTYGEFTTYILPKLPKEVINDD